jgi:TM2 domain-containing membrane protein YozV
MKSVERFVIVASSLITFLLVSAGITAIYLTVGGTFKLHAWNIGLLIYTILEIYLACLVIKVSLKRPEQIKEEQ